MFLESRAQELEDDELSKEMFVDALFREAKALNSDVDERSVRVAINDGDLSWAVIEDQKKHVMVQTLRGIENLDESQCKNLFEKMDGLVPTKRRWMRRACALRMKSNFCEKCMCCISEHIQC